MTCIKHTMRMTGDFSTHIAGKRRELVLQKINPLLTSLANEEFTDTECQLFGPGFEQRLTIQLETAETIGKASKVGKPFFRGAASRGSFKPRGGRMWSTFQSFQTVVQPNRKVLGCSTRVQQHVDADSFLVSRAHVHSDPTCNRLEETRPKHLPQGMFLHLVLQSLSKNLLLAGRLKYFSLIWEQITQDPWLLVTKLPHVKRPLKTRGLVGKNRSKRCPLNSTHLEKPPEVPSFSAEREHAGVCLPPLWPSNSTQGLHQTHEAGNSFTATKRVSPNYLFRRYTFDGRVASSSPLSSSINSEFARKPRFHCQLQEIPFRPSTTIRVFRGPSGHQRPFPLLARRKTKKDSEEVPKHSRSIGNISKGIIKIPGPLDLFHSSDLPCPLHFRHLQNLKNKTMAFCHSYEALTQLDQASKEEILWWRDHLQAWNGRALFQKPVQLIIEKNASRKGWGAYCQGISRGGPWCLEEKGYTSTA